MISVVTAALSLVSPAMSRAVLLAAPALSHASRQCGFVHTLQVARSKSENEDKVASQAAPPAPKVEPKDSIRTANAAELHGLLKKGAVSPGLLKDIISGVATDRTIAATKPRRPKARATRLEAIKATFAVPFSLSLANGARLGIFTSPVAAEPSAADSVSAMSPDEVVEALLKAHTDFSSELEVAKASGGVTEYFSDIVANGLSKNPDMPVAEKHYVMQQVVANLVEAGAQQRKAVREAAAAAARAEAEETSK
jgi:hypothetical protein